MGLDIVAYRRIEFIHPASEQTEACWDNDEHIHVYGQDFPDRLDGLTPGCYTGEDAFHFRAGSYGGYGEWRRHLCWSALGIAPDRLWNEYDRWLGKPFVELINFADNEGTIGPKTSAKLRDDFKAWPIEGPIDDVHGWFMEKFEDWAKAFELAADDGCVVFG